ncbi:MAG: hypothetical protein ACOX5G_07635 [Kiritimatiellia bacterium]|jgi:hypothetical protein
MTFSPRPWIAPALFLAAVAAACVALSSLAKSKQRVAAAHRARAGLAPDLRRLAAYEDAGAALAASWEGADPRRAADPLALLRDAGFPEPAETSVQTAEHEAWRAVRAKLAWPGIAPSNAMAIATLFSEARPPWRIERFLAEPLPDGRHAALSLGLVLLQPGTTPAPAQ